MALTQSQVSALYIALLGRASEGEGSKYWLNTSKSANLSMADVARFIMNDKEAKANFASHFETPEKLVDFIYANAFGKGAGVDQEGKAFWINHLKNGVDQATIVSEILKGALAEKYAKSTDTTIKNDFSLFINKIAASNMVSESVEKLPEGGIKALQAINKAVKPATKVAEVKNLITANETLKSAVDTTKLEKAATANDPAKVIANVTGAKAEEITKILKENPVVSTDGSGDSNAGADSNAGSNVNNGIDEIIVPAPGSGSGDSETPTVTIAQADLANTAATNLKIADSAASIQGALDNLVTYVAKVASINASDNNEIEMTKAQFDALKEKLTDNNDTIKVTELAAGDVAIAENAKVDSFTMNGGNKLTVTAAQAEALKTKAGNDSLAVSDTAENIKNALADLVTNAAKVASINASDDGSEIEMTKAQFDALKEKLTDNNDTIKVTELAAGDVAIAENAKVDSFTMNGGNKLTVTAAQAEALKTKAGNDSLAVSDTAENIKTALDNLVTNVAKVASINASNVGGGNDDSEIAMTKAQFDALKDKLIDNNDTIKVTGLATTDVAIAENGKVDSFTMNGSDKLTVTVAQAETIKAKAGNDSLAVKDIEASTLDNTALGKLADASLKDKIAKIDTDDNAAITLSVEQFKALGAKFEAGENLTIDNATGTLEATRATDTFKLKANASALAITGFTHGTDKVNVKAIAGMATEFEAATAPTADVPMATGKAYYVDGSAIDSSGLGDSFNATTAGAAGFDKLFAATGKAFKTTVTGATTALLAVKVDADTIQLYKIDSNGDSTATDITATDLTLVGSVTGADIATADFAFTA